MTALTILNIKKEIKRGQKTFSDKTVNVLLSRIETLEIENTQLGALVKVLQMPSEKQRTRGNHERR